MWASPRSGGWEASYLLRVLLSSAYPIIHSVIFHLSEWRGVDAHLLQIGKMRAKTRARGGAALSTDAGHYQTAWYAASEGHPAIPVHQGITRTVCPDRTKTDYPPWVLPLATTPCLRRRQRALGFAFAPAVQRFVCLTFPPVRRSLGYMRRMGDLTTY